MSDVFYVHLMDTDYVAECLTVFHGNGAAIDRIRTDFMSGRRPSTSLSFMSVIPVCLL